MSPSEITGRFHDLFYSSQVWRNTYWKSTPVLKCPLDLWTYQTNRLVEGTAGQV